MTNTETHRVVEHTVKVGPASMRALRDFLSNPTGGLRVNDRLTLEAVEGGGVLVRTGPFLEPAPHDSRCTALYHHRDCPEWSVPF